MKRLVALLFVLMFAVSAFAQTPTATPTAAYDFPANPTLGQQATGPNGQIFQWDGLRWIVVPGAGGGAGTVTSITAGTGLTGGTITTSGTIALGANPTGGQLNFAPLASPTFSGTLTFPGGGTATFNQFVITQPLTVTNGLTLNNGINVLSGNYQYNGANIGGTCTPGQFVSALSGHGVLTCAAPPASPTFTNTAWTPMLGGTQGNPVVTYTGTHLGGMQQIGTTGIFFWWFNVGWSAITTAGVGSLTVTGLPRQTSMYGGGTLVGSCSSYDGVVVNSGTTFGGVYIGQISNTFWGSEADPHTPMGGGASLIPVASLSQQGWLACAGWAQ